MEISEIIKEKMGIIEKEYAAKYNVRVCIDYTYTIDNIDNDCPITPLDSIALIDYLLNLAEKKRKSKIRNWLSMRGKQYCTMAMKLINNKWKLAKS